MAGIPVIWLIVGLMIVVVIFVLSSLATLFRRAGPHEAIIVYGLRGIRIVKGGGTVVFPMVESAKTLYSN